MKQKDIWAKILLLAVGAFYVLPMLAMARFSFQRVPVIKLGWSTLLKNWTIDQSRQLISSLQSLPKNLVSSVR
jgi:ABC-type glycerol-3-phosphate transport system permease component